MGLPTLKKFLCCISLETGGLIVGWIQIVISFLAIFGLITIMSVTIVAYNHGDVSDQDGITGLFAGESDQN